MSDNYWQDEADDQQTKVPEDVVDLVFRTECRGVPMDHAWLLSRAIAAALPWYDDDPGAAMHIIHGAGSGNGWYRPESGSDLLYLTRRTRLELRVPAERVEAAKALTGQTLDVGDNALLVGTATVRPLSRLTTLHSRYISSGPQGDQVSEEEFLGAARDGMRAIGIRPRKMLSGRVHRLTHPDGDIHTRSLMVADLDLEDAVRLQEQGLGPNRKMGCGLFIPHKAIKTTVPEL